MRSLKARARCGPRFPAPPCGQQRGCPVQCSLEFRRVEPGRCGSRRPASARAVLVDDLRSLVGRGEITAIGRSYSLRNLCEKLLLPFDRMAILQRIGNDFRRRQAGAGRYGIDPRLEIIGKIESDGHPPILTRKMWADKPAAVSAVFTWVKNSTAYLPCSRAPYLYPLRPPNFTCKSTPTNNTLTI